MFRFSDIIEIQGKNESIAGKIISDSTETSESINNTGTKYASVEDPQSMHRTASNEVPLISEIPNIINEENVIISPGQEKKNQLQV